MGATRVLYDGSRIIPAPFVNISKNYQTTGDGEKIGATFQIQLIGTLVAFKGSPTSSGTWWVAGGYPPDSRTEPSYSENIDTDSRLAAILRKQESLRVLFASDGKQLEIQSADGSAPLRCNPRVISIDFSNDIWFDRCQYTVNLEADVVTVDGLSLGEDSFDPYISSAQENWSFETNEEPEELEIPRTYRVTHTISAAGKRFFDSANNLQKPAWQQARDWVLPRLGFDSTIALSSGVNNLPSYYQALNHVRSENVGENDGTYSVTETWVLASGNVIEDFNIESTTDLRGGLTSVNIAGSVRGFESRDANMNVTQSKWEAAEARWPAVQGMAFSRAQSYSGTSLNSLALNTSVGRNPVAGTINYTFSFDNRPTDLFTGTLSESISVNDTFGNKNVATVFVLGRSYGPVLQDLGTYQPSTRALSIELVFGPQGGTAIDRFRTNHPRNDATISNELNTLLGVLEPVNAGMGNNVGVAATYSRVIRQNESWDPSNGRYSYQLEWIYE